MSKLLDDSIQVLEVCGNFCMVAILEDIRSKYFKEIGSTKQMQVMFAESRFLLVTRGPEHLVEFPFCHSILIFTESVFDK